MTQGQHTLYGPNPAAASLRAKLHRFAASLTLEERAHVRAMRAAGAPDPLMPSLDAKAMLTAFSLTPEEKAELVRMLYRADPRATTESDEVSGYAALNEGDEDTARPDTALLPSLSDTGGSAVPPLLMGIGLLLRGGTLPASVSISRDCLS
jgi:hypothetical protein